MTTRSLVRHLETMRTASDIPGASIRERWNGFYALNLYHPVAALARAWRRQSRVLRGKQCPHEQATRLPRVAWTAVLPNRSIALTETRRRSGNVRLAELGMLAQAAAAAASEAPRARGRRGAVCREVGARRAVQLDAICGAPHHAALRRFGDVRLVGARAQGGSRLRRRLARL